MTFLMWDSLHSPLYFCQKFYPIILNFVYIYFYQKILFLKNKIKQTGLTRQNKNRVKPDQVNPTTRWPKKTHQTGPLALLWKARFPLSANPTKRSSLIARLLILINENLLTKIKLLKKKNGAWCWWVVAMAGAEWRQCSCDTASNTLAWINAIIDFLSPFNSLINAHVVNFFTVRITPVYFIHFDHALPFKKKFLR